MSGKSRFALDSTEGITIKYPDGTTHTVEEAAAAHEKSQDGKEASGEEPLQKNKHGSVVQHPAETDLSHHELKSRLGLHRNKGHQPYKGKS